MSNAVLRSVVVFILVVQPLFLVYFVLYNTYTLWLIMLAAREIRRRVAGHFIEDLDLIDHGDLTKPLTMIVPAYNEEVTIVDSVTALIQCDYPRFEIVIVNDGSSDATLERLQRAFQLRRTDAPYRPAIATAPVNAIYVATTALPARVTQVVVIDKENGGKADALNVGINASTAPYFAPLDANSILDQHALKELMRVIQEDPKVVAVAGQVAIANGCTVRNHVIQVALPSQPLPRFQMVEYLRSFIAARTGLDRMYANLILNGVFAVFEKDTVIRAGGYLTPFLRHRLIEEYVGLGMGTVCENMEIIVRLHRFLLDKLHARRIAFLPHPVMWTQVPENFGSLRKQRGRWYRGLRESLRYHRSILWQSKFGRIGWFTLPAFWLFEYLGPLVEIAGYGFLLILLWADKVLGLPVMGYEYLLAFLLASVGYGILVNVLAVVVGTWRFRYGLADHLQRRLLPFGRRREVLILLLYAVLENLGYRQLTLYWRFRGLWDAWRGKSGWEKSSRMGFRPGEAAAHG